jgi:hypothetical protein
LFGSYFNQRIPTTALPPDTSSKNWWINAPIALNVALEDFESEKMRLEGLGLKANATVHEWLHVRSLYFPDPEGNLLEFVCYDASVG